ncbi:MAG: YggT family protein [Gammaproteobacteria bacterium]|nr:YggT family protein [Gammaproteobacteria bacterium]
MSEPIAFIINFILGAVAVLFLARFILQACRADFYNPISQGIVRFTDPVLRPIRMVIPTYKNLDFAAFVATWLVNIAMVAGVAVAMGGRTSVANALVSGLRETLGLFLDIYWIAILAIIILSFLAPGTSNPVSALLRQITDPILIPARRLVPPLGGLDLSPLLVFLVLGLIDRYVLPSIFQTLF